MMRWIYACRKENEELIADISQREWKIWTQSSRKHKEEPIIGRLQTITEA